MGSGTTWLAPMKTPSNNDVYAGSPMAQFVDGEWLSGGLLMRVDRRTTNLVLPVGKFNSNDV